MSITSVVFVAVRALGSLLNILDKYRDYVKRKQDIEQGRKEIEAEIAKNEAAIVRDQTEILTKDVTKEETTNKLDMGKF